MSEQWRPIIGYEGLYEVSDHGRVKSLTRFDSIGRRVIERIRILNKDGGGYYQVNLSKDGAHKNVQVHAEMAKAFLGSRPDGHEARHLDGDKTNNTISNIKWGTKSENTLDQVLHGTHHCARRVKCPRGHKLEPPNLATQSGRRCRSCQRAQDKVRHAALDKSLIQEIADTFYKELMIE